MKTRLFKGVWNILCSVSVIAAADSVYATSTTINSAEYFALVNPGSPTDNSDDTAELNDVLAHYATSYTVNHPSWGNNNSYTITMQNLGALPSSTATLAGDASQTGTSFSLNLGNSTYDYLMVKWDNRDVFYDISGLTGTLNVINDLVLNNSGQAEGASDYKLFNQASPGTGGSPGVPDGGATVTLLGFALVGMNYLRRKTGAK